MSNKEQKFFQAIIACFNALHFLSEVKRTEVVKHADKKLLSRTVEMLFKYEHLYNILENEDEEKVMRSFGIHFDHVKKALKEYKEKSKDLKLIEQAYIKDPKAIMGITKKTLR